MKYLESWFLTANRWALIVLLAAMSMIIFANILLDKQIISSATFTALLLMAVASTMLTTPVVSPKLMRMKNQSA